MIFERIPDVFFIYPTFYLLQEVCILIHVHRHRHIHMHIHVDICLDMHPQTCVPIYIFIQVYVDSLFLFLNS